MTDIFESMKWTLILALLVGLYKVLVYFGGSVPLPSLLTPASS